MVRPFRNQVYYRSIDEFLDIGKYFPAIFAKKCFTGKIILKLTRTNTEMEIFMNVVYVIRYSTMKIVCHLQIGRGLKRNPDDLEGPPVKRRITQYDDPEDSYRISVIGGHQIPKFNTTSTRYQITFKNIAIRGIPNILKSLRILFNSIIKNITEYMDSSDLVRMSVQCPELDFALSLPFMRLSQLNAKRFFSEIERVLQSYEQFVLVQGLEIELIHVELPSGGIGKHCKFVDLEQMLHEKRCF